jgi:hypothetical protein
MTIIIYKQQQHWNGFEVGIPVFAIAIFIPS